MKTESVSPMLPNDFSTKKNGNENHETDNTYGFQKYFKGTPRKITPDVLKSVGRKDPIYEAAARVALQKGLLVLES